MSIIKLCDSPVAIRARTGHKDRDGQQGGAGDITRLGSPGNAAAPTPAHKRQDRLPSQLHNPGLAPPPLVLFLDDLLLADFFLVAFFLVDFLAAPFLAAFFLFAMAFPPLLFTVAFAHVAIRPYILKVLPRVQGKPDSITMSGIQPHHKNFYKQHTQE